MDKVQNNLYQKLEDLYQKYKKENQKKLPTKKHFSSISLLNKKIEVLDKESMQLDQAQEEIRVKRRLLREQVNVVEHEIEALDPKLDTEEENAEAYRNYKELSLDVGFTPGYYSLRKTEYQAIMSLSLEKDFRNYKNWRKIQSKYEDLRTLAISNKQKQQIILDLQNKIDWH